MAQVSEPRSSPAQSNIQDVFLNFARRDRLNPAAAVRWGGASPHQEGAHHEAEEERPHGHCPPRRAGGLCLHVAHCDLPPDPVDGESVFAAAVRSGSTISAGGSTLPMAHSSSARACSRAASAA